MWFCFNEYQIHALDQIGTMIELEVLILGIKGPRMKIKHYTKFLLLAVIIGTLLVALLRISFPLVSTGEYITFVAVASILFSFFIIWLTGLFKKRRDRISKKESAGKPGFEKNSNSGN